jgi:small subunit ribosomal protein S4
MPAIPPARVKIVRRFGTPLPGLTQKDTERRPYPPGEHGQSRRRRRKSEYRERLEEKQKVRLNYGLKEKQLRGYFERAKESRDATGEALVALLERRLDSVVFRLGFTRTIPAARQLVVHGHVRVDDQKQDRPGYEVGSGDEISVAEEMRNNVHVRESVEDGPRVSLPGHLKLDPDDPFVGRVVDTPTVHDTPVLVDETAIVEFYAR